MNEVHPHRHGDGHLRAQMMEKQPMLQGGGPCSWAQCAHCQSGSAGVGWPLPESLGRGTRLPALPLAPRPCTVERVSPTLHPACGCQSPGMRETPGPVSFTPGLRLGVRPSGALGQPGRALVSLLFLPDPPFSSPSESLYLCR